MKQQVNFLMVIIIITFISCGDSKKLDSENAKMDVELKNQLELILLRDQGIREILKGSLSSEKKDELLKKIGYDRKYLIGNKKFEVLQEIDSTNLYLVERIIAKYGYPSKSLVGEPANEAIYYVIQHSDKIDKYLPLIRKAAENNDISKKLLAMMEDRNLMYKGVEQIYGSQIKGKINSQGNWNTFLWPLKNSDSVNSWRKKVGFEQSLEEYIKSRGVEYRLYTIKEIKEL